MDMPPARQPQRQPHSHSRMSGAAANNAPHQQSPQPLDSLGASALPPQMEFLHQSDTTDEEAYTNVVCLAVSLHPDKLVTGDLRTVSVLPLDFGGIKDAMLSLLLSFGFEQRPGLHPQETALSPYWHSLPRNEEGPIHRDYPARKERLGLQHGGY